MEHTPGEWKPIWWGNEQYPYPLSIMAEDEGAWIARDGTVSSEAHARLMTASPKLLKALQGAEGHFLNAKIDLETGAKKSIALDTIEAGLRFVRAALADAPGGDD